MRKISGIILISFAILIAETEKIFKGQFIAAPSLSYQHQEYRFRGYGRYLPLFEYARYDDLFNLSFDMAGNFYTNFETDPEAELYRLKFGISNNQSELRLGLQKLNFGPAQILRSLQWFDTMNPTDPLKLTDGVYGALFRHYFLNNTNIWLWSLYGNSERKGIETIGTQKKSPEFGGRAQGMLLKGEMGVTAHYREIPGDKEYRVALDGRWDQFVGSWFESVLLKSNTSQTVLLTLGTDYTFEIGNGLYCMTEHMLSDMDTDLFDQQSQFSTLMITYPLTLFDNLSSITYYSWDTNEWSQYISWQRTYNRVMLNLNLFHFPEQPSRLQSMAGYGIELKFIYNH